MFIATCYPSALVPEGPNVYSYPLSIRFGLRRSPMFGRATWRSSRARNLFTAGYKHLAALRPVATKATH